MRSVAAGELFGQRLAANDHAEARRTREITIRAATTYDFDVIAAAKKKPRNAGLFHFLLLVTVSLSCDDG